MKIKVSEIKPNPFRNFEHYPIDKAKVETLKASIQETTFWDNILVRQKNGDYELAYGHHRWIALGELGINEIDIPVRDLSDSVMLKMMANENMDQWGSQPFVIYATVRAVRDYLDSELAKYERWEDLHVNKSINMLFESNSQFQNCKRNGVGQTTIKTFLGEPWKQWVIQKALEVIKDESANEDAFTIFDNITQADAFHKAIKNKDLTDKEQKKLAKKVKKRIKGNSGSAGSTTERIVKRIVDQELDGVDEFESTLNDIVLDIDQITIQAKSLNKKIGELNGKLLDLDILELKHIKTIFALQSFSELSDSIIKLTSYFNNKQLNL